MVLANLVCCLCCGSLPVSESLGRALVNVCLRRGFDTMPPSAVCGIVDAFAQQYFIHRGLTAKAMERMNFAVGGDHGDRNSPRNELARGGDLRCCPSLLRMWLGALVGMRTEIPAPHLDACLRALGARSRISRVYAGPAATAAAPMLRALLLAKVAAGSQPLRHGMLMAGQLLSSMGRGGSGMGLVASRAALADVEWLLRHSPPPWWEASSLAPHHRALLLASQSNWHDLSREALELRADVSTILEESVLAALSRLRCKPARGLNLGHLEVRIALPELQVALECVGPPVGELRKLDDTPPTNTASLDVPPMVELRHAQLRACGWIVEVVRATEWPTLSSTTCTGESVASIERKQEMLLRRKLAGALQRHVPSSRRADLARS